MEPRARQPVWPCPVNTQHCDQAGTELGYAERAMVMYEGSRNDLEISTPQITLKCPGQNLDIGEDAKKPS